MTVPTVPGIYRVTYEFPKGSKPTQRFIEIGGNSPFCHAIEHHFGKPLFPAQPDVADIDHMRDFKLLITLGDK